MTTTRTARKPRLRERREERIAKSAARQAEHAAQRLESAQTPLELLARSYELLRGRLVQYERKAQAALDRADTDGARQRAVRRLETVRAEMERIVGDATAEMARLTEQIHTERR